MKNNAKRFQDKLARALVFLIRFNIFAIPLYAIILSGFSIPAFQDLTAHIVSSALGSFGIQNVLSGLTITVPTYGGSFSGIINWDCTGWKSMLAFLALVFATDESLRKKMMSLAFLPLIYVANIARITALFAIVSVYGTDNFQFIHLMLFGVAMIALILIFWIVWLKFMKTSKNKLIDSHKRRAVQ